MHLTIANLVERYTTDQESRFRKLSYNVRVNNGRYLARIGNDHGSVVVTKLDRRTIKRWHERWSAGGKLATGKAFVAQLKAVLLHSFLHHDDQDCRRSLRLLERMSFGGSKPRTAELTPAQVEAICAKAHEVGYHSIALAQVLQWQLRLRQKDVIGEWVPLSESIASDVAHRRMGKWLRGLRWEEIDENWILRHATSRKKRPVPIDLTRAPLVKRELDLHIDFLGTRPATGPVVIYEGSAVPWAGPQFRRKWRLIADLAGLPKEVKNMDSRV